MKDRTVIYPLFGAGDARRGIVSYREIAVRLRSSDVEIARGALIELVQGLNPKLEAWLRGSGLREQSVIDDVLQEVWKRVWQKRMTVNPTLLCQSWVFTICLNIVRDEKNERAQRGETSIGDVPEAAAACLTPLQQLLERDDGPQADAFGEIKVPHSRRDRHLDG